MKAPVITLVASMVLAAAYAEAGVIEARAYEVEGKRGGLGLQFREEGGDWEYACGKNHAFTHSNLGNWGEKAILDPFVVERKDGAKFMRATIIR